MTIGFDKLEDGEYNLAIYSFVRSYTTGKATVKNIIQIGNFVNSDTVESALSLGMVLTYSYVTETSSYKTTIGYYYYADGKSYKHMILQTGSSFTNEEKTMVYKIVIKDGVISRISDAVKQHTTYDIPIDITPQIPLSGIKFYPSDKIQKLSLKYLRLTKIK